MASRATNGHGNGNGNGERGRGAAARASARREREREIVEATRALFDERGVQDAPMEEIARAVGINKALIYRHFASQEELFVLTVTHYLDELGGRFAAVDPSMEPMDRLRRLSEVYLEFCLEYPAFLDCALSLMRRPYGELGERVSPGVLFRLGQAMSSCLSPLSQVLAEGAEQGVFKVSDPDFLANLLYAQGLGAMHLARVAAGVRELAPNVPQIFPVDAKDVMSNAIEMTFMHVIAPSTNGHAPAPRPHTGDQEAADQKAADQS
jgi:AcrR family transcriptional regulator